MGQKINPNGFRLSVSRNWTSRWYANNTDFANMLKEDVEVRNYLKKKLKDLRGLLEKFLMLYMVKIRSL
jgi:small subunit ribosomal protein S3